MDPPKKEVAGGRQCAVTDLGRLQPTRLQALYRVRHFINNNATIMNEHHKLDEARHFLSRLASATPNPKIFSFELSAFLSAARSVLQYALEEARPKHGGKAWYDSYVSTSQTIKYFKDKRDMNIHVKPVLPNQHIGITESVNLSLHEHVSIKLIDEHGKIVEEHNISASPPALNPTPPTSVAVFFRFSDWSDVEDVETLCRIYVDDVAAMLRDGEAKGFIVNV